MLRRDRRTRRLAALLAALALAAVPRAGADGGALEVALRPHAARLGLASSVAELAAGRAVSAELETTNESEIAATAAVVVEAPLDLLVDEVVNLELLRKRGVLTASGRFSPEPKLSDLAALEVPQTTLEAMGRAKYRASDVKLSSAEIAAARRAKPEERAALFKGFLLRRAIGWRQNGVEGLGAYHDKRVPVLQSKATQEMLDGLARTRPDGALPVEARYQYWSVEQYGSLKPVIALSDMTVMRGDGVARIETVMLYANHYFDGLVTALDFAEVASERGPATLVRLTFRARLDIFDGLLGGLKRRVGRSRTVKELGENLERLRETYGRPKADAPAAGAPAAPPPGASGS